jgi:hypothetical protein
MRSTELGSVAAFFASVVLVAGCGSSATPAPSSASGALATAAPSAVAPTTTPPAASRSSAPTPTPALTPTSTPTPTPTEGSTGRVCPETVTPSSLAAMVGQDRVDCFGGRDLVFDADIVVAAGTIVDGVAFDVPAIFWPVKRPSSDWADPATTWPVYLVDAGATDVAPGATLDLSVADPSLVPEDLRSRLHARVTGHVDDPAAVACRPPPAGFIGSEATEEHAVLMCRAAFVVTSIEPLG